MIHTFSFDQNKRFIFAVLALLISILFFASPTWADSHLKDEVKTEETNAEGIKTEEKSNKDENTEEVVLTEAEKKEAHTLKTLATMLDFVQLEKSLRADIDKLQRQIKRDDSESAVADLKIQIKEIEEKLKDTSQNISNLAADTDLAVLDEVEEKPFDIQKEVLSLLEPALKELKHATSGVKKKSDLREKIVEFSAKEPILQEALANVSDLNKRNKNRNIRTILEKMNDELSKQLVYVQSELQAKELQLEKIEQEEIALLDKSEGFFKNFFERRGWVLIKAFLVIIGIILLSRLVKFLLKKFVKGYEAQYRSVQVRVVDLAHRLGTLVLIIIGPMLVFYLSEDWVLFSLGILFLIAAAWKLAQTIPRYWAQLELFLNVGPVREGERLIFNNIPWVVKNINMYSVLENPVADLNLRLDINDLVDLRSRKFESHEPWFPCKKGDWVILKDGLRGKVIGISLELVQLIQRGGAVTTYQMDNFLSLSPLNMSKSYRIKETFGIAYKHQQESTTKIVETLKATINSRAEDEGYKDIIQNINVEFESAGDSALNLVVIGDFKGEAADISNRLRRSIQRWCIDAATENDWEVPFPQLQLHAEKLFQA